MSRILALVPRDEVRPCMLALVSSVGNIEGVSARKRRRGFCRKLNRTVVDCFARVAARGLRNLSYSVAIVLKDPTVWDELFHGLTHDTDDPTAVVQ